MRRWPIVWCLAAAGIAAAAACVGENPDLAPADDAGEAGSENDAGAEACETCGLPACPDSSTDNANCGACGNVCAGTESCFEGRCGGARVKELAAGGEFGCALLTSGSVYCWGANEFGQLGNAADTTDCGIGTDGPFLCRPAPRRVMGLPRATKIAAARWSVCALLEDKTISCWGRSELGAIGHDPTADPRCYQGKECTRTPIPIGGLSDVAEMTLSELSGCARTGDDRVFCWGLNKHANIGDGTIGTESDPKLSPVLSIDGGVKRVAMSSHFFTHACSLRSDGSVACWGTNTYGATGHDGGAMGDGTCPQGNHPCTRAPAAVGGLTGIIADVMALNSASCAVNGTGTVFCWGLCTEGITGNAPCAPAAGNTFRLPPAALSVPGNPGFVALAGKNGHACGVQGNGDRTIWCWGRDESGQLGAGTIANGAECAVPCRRTPVTTALKGTPSPGAGPFTLAVDLQGRAWGWGANVVGEIGHPPGADNDIMCGATKCNPTPKLVVGLP